MESQSIDIAALRGYLTGLQQSIVSALEARDGGSFRIDRWDKESAATLSGHGISCMLEDGALIERGGVGFSHVRGGQLPASATARRAELAGRAFEALGVSVVVHPRNPYIPTAHMNVRCLVARASNESDVWWVGGGMDLTPYYGFTEDARHFHANCKAALEPFGSDLYGRFKKACDEYFYLKHRQEARGIGGIFFDDFNELAFADSFALLRSVGDRFLAAYLPIVEARRELPYGGRERDWQSYRRGRYVEFNLVLDRGTHFGLQSGGRTESILMSMPPLARWRYEYHPEAQSPEADLLLNFLPAREWLS